MLAGTRCRIFGAGYLTMWRTNYYHQLTLAAWRGSHFQLIIHHRLVRDLTAAWRSDTRRNSLSEVLSPDDPILKDISQVVAITQMMPTGARGRPGKIATVLLKSGTMVKVTLKILNLLDCAKELKQEYHARLQASQPAVTSRDKLRKLQAGKSISIGRPVTTKSAAPTPRVLRNNSSAPTIPTTGDTIEVFWPQMSEWYRAVVVDFDPADNLHKLAYADKDGDAWYNLSDPGIDPFWRSRPIPATPSQAIDPSLQVQEQSPAKIPPSNDTLRDLLKQRLGASSLSPMPARLDLSNSAARELAEATKLLEVHKHEGQLRDAEGTTQEHIDRWKTTGNKSKKVQGKPDSEEVLLKQAAAAGASEHLMNMLRDSSTVQQSDNQMQQIMEQLSTMQDSLVSLTAQNVTLAAAVNSKTEPIIPYADDTTRKFEQRIDKVTFTNAEDFSEVAGSTPNTCLEETCHEIVAKGSKVCNRGHPIHTRQLKCPWPKCGRMLRGTTKQRLRQPICTHCTKPQLICQTDPMVVLQLQKQIAAETGDSKYSDTCAGDLGEAIPKGMRVTEFENAVTMTHVAGNSEFNYIVAEEAGSANEKLEQMQATASAVSKDLLLGEETNQAITERMFLAMFKGLSVGKSGGKKRMVQLFEFLSESGILHNTEFLAWNKKDFNAELKEPDWAHKDAPNWLQQYFDGLTLFIRRTLNDTLADDHAAGCVILMECLKAEGRFKVRFSVENIFRKHAAWLGWYHDMCIAYVSNSPYFSKLYDHDLLWNFLGTDAQMPKLVLRFFRGGRAVWISIFDKLFDEPQRQSLAYIAQEKLKEHKNKDLFVSFRGKTAQPSELITQGRLFWDYNGTKDKTSSWEHFASSSEIVWCINKASETTVTVPFKACLCCLEADPDHLMLNCPSLAAPHPLAKRLKGGEPALDFELFAAILKKSGCDLATDSTDSRSMQGKLQKVAALYVKEVKNPSKLSAEQLGHSADKSHFALLKGKARQNDSIRTWLDNTAEPRSDILQPDLSDQKATLTVTKVALDKSKFSTFDIEPVGQLEVALSIPSQSNGKDHVFTADGVDRDEVIEMPAGVFEGRKCQLCSVCEDKKISASAALQNARGDSRKFVKQADKIKHMYNHLNHLDVSQVHEIDRTYISKLSSSYADIMMRNQGATFFWVKGGWLKEFGNGPIALWHEYDGVVQLQIFMLAVDAGQVSELESEVTHILGHEGHCYQLLWHDGLEVFQDLLVVLPHMYRYINAAIEPCMHLNDTLQGKQYYLPDYLTCSSFLPSLVKNTVQQVSLEGKRPNAEIESAPSEGEDWSLDTQWCSSCKSSMSPSKFVSPTGKVTASCAACLTRKKDVYHTNKSQRQLEVTEAYDTESPAVVSKLIVCIAVSVESLAWHLVGIDSQDATALVASWSTRIAYKLFSKTTCSSETRHLVLDTRQNVVQSTDQAMDQLKALVNAMAAESSTWTQYEALTKLNRLSTHLRSDLSAWGIPVLQRPTTAVDTSNGNALFHCACSQKPGGASCKHTVSQAGSHCARCSNYSGFFTWFINPTQCECYCDHCRGRGSSDDEEGQPVYPRFGTHTPKETADTQEVNQDHRLFTAAVQQVIPCIGFWFYPIKQSQFYTPNTVLDVTISGHTAVNNLLAALLEYCEEEPYSESMDFQLGYLMDRILDTAHAAEWQAAVKHIANQYAKLRQASIEMKQVSNQWAWSISRVKRIWEQNITSEHCVTLTPNAIAMCRQAAALEDFAHVPYYLARSNYDKWSSQIQTFNESPRSTNPCRLSMNVLLMQSHFETTPTDLGLASPSVVQATWSRLARRASIDINRSDTMNFATGLKNHQRWASIGRKSARRLMVEVRVRQLSTHLSKLFNVCITTEPEQPTKACICSKCTRSAHDGPYCDKCSKKCCKCPCFPCSDAATIQRSQQPVMCSCKGCPEITGHPCTNRAVGGKLDESRGYEFCESCTDRLCECNCELLAPAECKHPTIFCSNGAAINTEVEANTADGIICSYCKMVVCDDGPVCSDVCCCHNFVCVCPPSPSAPDSGRGALSSADSDHSQPEDLMSEVFGCQSRSLDYKQDAKFDFEMQSPSLPVGWSKNVNDPPLKQLAEARVRVAQSEDDYVWAERVHQKFPAKPVRRSTRCKRASKQYVIDVSHSSMDTSISSSVSPGAFREATGLTANLNSWVASNSTPSDPALPAYLRLPTQDVINKTFSSRTKQLQMSSFFEKKGSKLTNQQIESSEESDRLTQRTWDDWRECCLKSCSPVFFFTGTAAEQKAAALQVQLFISQEVGSRGCSASSVAAKLQCVAAKHRSANLSDPFCSNSLVKAMMEQLIQSAPAEDELHCLLCDCVMPVSRCKHDPTKFKDFCGHCWTNSKSVCRKLLGVSSSQVEAAPAEALYIPPMICKQGSELSAEYAVNSIAGRTEALHKVAAANESVQFKWRLAACMWRWQGQANVHNRLTENDGILIWDSEHEDYDDDAKSVAMFGLDQYAQLKASTTMLSDFR